MSGWCRKVGRSTRRRRRAPNNRHSEAAAAGSAKEFALLRRSGRDQRCSLWAGGGSRPRWRRRRAGWRSGKASLWPASSPTRSRPRPTTAPILSRCVFASAEWGPAPRRFALGAGPSSKRAVGSNLRNRQGPERSGDLGRRGPMQRACCARPCGHFLSRDTAGDRRALVPLPESIDSRRTGRIETPAGRHGSALGRRRLQSLPRSALTGGA